MAKWGAGGGTMRIRQTKIPPGCNSLRELPTFGVLRSRCSEEKPPKGGTPNQEKTFDNSQSAFPKQFPRATAFRGRSTPHHPVMDGHGNWSAPDNTQPNNSKAVKNNQMKTTFKTLICVAICCAAWSAFAAPPTSSSQTAQSIM
jgi:hypothetical protein